MYKHCDFWEIGEFYDDDVLGGVSKNASEAVAVGRVCLRVVYCWRRAQGTCLLQVRQLEPSCES